VEKRKEFSDSVEDYILYDAKPCSLVEISHVTGGPPLFPNAGSCPLSSKLVGN